MMKNKNKPSIQKDMESNPMIKKKTGVMPWVWLVLALGYTLFPLDLVPDTFPILGWLDDLSILSAAILNLFQHYHEDTHKKLATILKYLKWLFLLFVVLLILILGLLGYLVFFNN
ncbi:MAG TPA: YkvA family protein [Flavobacteriaceae bacterium]|nr:YkvA family protein [Flavobacteriaceae bacterium]